MQRCMNHSPCTCQSKNLQLTYLEQNIKGYRWNEGKEEAYVISEMAVDFPKAYGDGVLISLFLQYLTSRYSPECNCSASLRCMSPRGSLFSGSLHLKDKAQVTKQDDIKLSHVLSRVPSLSLTPAPTSLHLQSYTFCFNDMQFVTFPCLHTFEHVVSPLWMSISCPFLQTFCDPTCNPPSVFSHMLRTVKPPYSNTGPIQGNSEHFTCLTHPFGTFLHSFFKTFSGLGATPRT